MTGRAPARGPSDRQAGALAAGFTVPDVRPGYYVIAATQHDDVYNIDNAGTPALASFEVLTPSGQSTVQLAQLGTAAPAQSATLVMSDRPGSKTHAVWVSADGGTLYAVNTMAPKLAPGTVSAVDLDTGGRLGEVVPTACFTSVRT